MVINGMLVSYKFGPEHDMDIRFSSSFKAQAGCSYEQCVDRAKLVFQLLCHAIHQIQYVERKRWRLDKIEEIESWEYPDPKPGESLEHVIQTREPVLVKHPLTLAKYQIKAEGRLVFGITEDYDCDYKIDYYDPTEDEWIDWVLDYAQKHCDRFGRIR